MKWKSMSIWNIFIKYLINIQYILLFVYDVHSNKSKKDLYYINVNDWIWCSILFIKSHLFEYLMFCKINCKNKQFNNKKKNQEWIAVDILKLFKISQWIMMVVVVVVVVVVIAICRNSSLIAMVKSIRLEKKCLKEKKNPSCNQRCQYMIK